MTAPPDVRALASEIAACKPAGSPVRSNAALYDANGMLVYVDGDDCIALARAVLATPPAWQPIATYGADVLNPNPVVLRPHRIHGAMDVRRLTDDEIDAFRDGGVLTRDVDWRWVNGDQTTAWTESAFRPYWMERPSPPHAAAPREDAQ